jgi:hypothetical protein
LTEGSSAVRSHRSRSSFETPLAKLALPAAVMLLQFAIMLLAVISMNEVRHTIFALVYDIRHKNELILYGTLLAVLTPSAGVLFWGCKAVWMELERPIGSICRHFRYRGKTPPMRSGAEPAPGTAEPGTDCR